MTEMENILKKMIDRGNSPSVQYFLFDENTIIKEYAFGYSNLSENRIVDRKTTYNAFSVTKTFTALAILQLAEEKRIDIDQSAKKYSPSFPYSPDITIRQLLSHTAGIPNPLPLNWIHLAAEHQSFDRDKFFAKIFLRNNKTKSKPNQKFIYSNLGYVLLGRLIEEVTGLNYEKYITDNIIRRLELKDEELGFEIPETGLHARGYHKRLSFSNLILGLLIDKSKYMGKAEGKWKPFYDFYVNGVSYGGLIGTPSAFVRYIQQLLKSNTHLLSNAYKGMLFKENLTADDKLTGMCLSWFSGQLNNCKYVSHAGGGGGYYCELRLYPEKGIGSVIFFNRTGVSDARVLDKIDKFYFL